MKPLRALSKSVMTAVMALALLISLPDALHAAGAPGAKKAAPKAAAKVVEPEPPQEEPPAEEAGEDQEDDALMDEFLLDDKDIEVDTSLSQEEHWDKTSQETPAEYTYSLQQVIDMALANSHQVKAAQFEVQIAQTRTLEAKGLWVPKIRVQAFVAPAPSYARPDDSSVDGFLNYNPDEWEQDTVTTRVEVAGIMPVYSFGRIETAMDMADTGVDVARAQMLNTTSDVVYTAHRAYYSMQYLNDLISVLGEGLSIAESARGTLEKMLSEQAESVTHVDLYKLEVVIGELKVRLKDARNKRDLLMESVRVLVGLPPRAPFYLATTEQESEDYVPSHYDDYLQSTFKNRPDFKLLQLGQQYSQQKYDMEVYNFLPTLFLSAWFHYAYTPNNYDARNPYFNDDFNYLSGGVALGLKWELDPLVQTARYQRAKAEKLKFEQTASLAHLGISLEIKEALENVMSKDYARDVNRTSFKAGKSWLVSETLNYSVGLTGTSEIIEAIGGFAKTQLYYYTSIYEYNLAVARLRQVTGEYSQRVKGLTYVSDQP